MANSPPPYESYWAFFRDVGITLLLFILAVQIAHFLSRPITEEIQLPYIVAFSIGIAPMFWFLRRCLIHNYDWWDYLALCFSIWTAWGLHHLLTDGDSRVMDILFTLLGAYLFMGWQKLRSKFHSLENMETH